MEAARSLYRGDVCEDLTASEWLIEAQGELRRKQLSVLLSLGDAYLEVGQPDELSRASEAVKTTDTLRMRIEVFCAPICSYMTTRRQRNTTNDCARSSSKS